MPYGEAKLPLAAGEASLRRELATSASMTIESGHSNELVALGGWPQRVQPWELTATLAFDPGQVIGVAGFDRQRHHARQLVAVEILHPRGERFEILPRRLQHQHGLRRLL